MKLILSAVDGSESSLKAAALAASLAAKYDAELILINVVEESAFVDDELRAFARTEGLGGTPYEVMTAFGNKALGDARSRASAAGARRAMTEIATGKPADAVVAAARGRSADLVVVGRRGRGQLAAALLGSVSQKIINEAPCPVLVVR
jgi:nucleotide-binding universal stress UspA family protein